MPSISRLLITCYCLFLMGCSTIPKKLEVAERVMENSPDSALHLLKQIQPSDISTDGNRALYGLLLFQVLNKNDLALKPDSLLNFSLNYYLKENDINRLPYCYYYKARIYKMAQRYDEATVLYLKALDQLQNSKNYYLLGKINADMGDVCSVQMDYEEALRKYHLSADYYNRAGKPLEASYRILDIGRTYRLQKKFKVAHKFYIQALTHSSDSIFQGSVLQEIGINYYWAKQNDSAQYYLRKSLLFPYISTNYSIRCYQLSDLFFLIAKYDSSFYYASMALKYQANFYTQRECYRILVNVEYLRKNRKRMGIYMTHYQSCTDSIRKVESQTKATVLETMHRTDIVANKTKLENQLLITLAILIIGLSTFFYYKLLKKSKLENRFNEQLYNEQTETIRRDELFKQQKVLLNKIESAKAEQSKLRKKSTIQEKERMDLELYNQLISFDDQHLFFKQMDVILNNLVTKLYALDTKITPKEIVWCCLHLLQIPNQDVLLLLNYKQGTLNKFKNRLYKKLKLNGITELNSFLINIFLKK